MTNPEDIGDLPTIESPLGAVEERPSTPEAPPSDPTAEAEERQREITRLTDSIEGTKAGINTTREALGLPPTDEDPPSVLPNRERLKRLEAAVLLEMDDEDVVVPLEENIDIHATGKLGALREELKRQRLEREERERVRDEQEKNLSPEEREGLNLEVEREIQALEQNRSEMRITRDIKTPDVLLADLDAITPQEGLLVNVPEDVLRTALDIKEKLLENLNDYTRFGPVYYVSTSKGETIIVRDAIFHTSNMWSGVSEERHVLVATDERGEALALRGARIEDDFDLRVHGTVLTLARGRGAASAVDMALKHILQRVSDSRRKALTWEAYNENLGALEKMERSEEKPETLALKRTEQERWQSLYGEGGRFGFRLSEKAGKGYQYDRYTKKIEPLSVRDESEAEMETPQGRIKSKLRYDLVSERAPQDIGEVYLRQGEEGMLAQEIPLPKDPALGQSRKEVLRTQFKTILNQMPGGEANPTSAETDR